MRTIQKLEVVFGCATLIAAIIEFCFESIPSIKKIGELHGETFSVEGLIRSVIFLLLPAIFVCFGSYFHSVRQYRWALTFPIIGGSILTLIFVIGIFSGAAFYFYGLTGTFLYLAPYILAMLTLIFAVRSRKLNVQ